MVVYQQIPQSDPVDSAEKLERKRAAARLRQQRCRARKRAAAAASLQSKIRIVNTRLGPTATANRVHGSAPPAATLAVPYLPRNHPQQKHIPLPPPPSATTSASADTPPQEIKPSPDSGKVSTDGKKKETDKSVVLATPINSSVPGKASSSPNTKKKGITSSTTSSSAPNAAHQFPYYMPPWYPGLAPPLPQHHPWGGYPMPTSSAASSSTEKSTPDGSAIVSATTSSYPPPAPWLFPPPPPHAIPSSTASASSCNNSKDDEDCGAEENTADEEEVSTTNEETENEDSVPSSAEKLHSTPFLHQHYHTTPPIVDANSGTSSFMMPVTTTPKTPARYGHSGSEDPFAFASPFLPTPNFRPLPPLRGPAFGGLGFTPIKSTAELSGP